MIPPKANAPFVAALEDVLAVDHRPPDDARPVVCVGEGGKPLIGEARPPLPVRPTSPAKEGREYVRNGTANRFLAFEPLAGWRHVEVTERRTSVDFAHFIRRLVDSHYRDAEKVVLALDNLSAHAPAALCEAFEPTEARRVCERLEWHSTPEHGPWLSVAGVELSVRARQGLDRRIPDREALRREVAAWEQERNAVGVVADWQFTTADARTRLKRLYPVIETAQSDVAEH